MWFKSTVALLFLIAVFLPSCTNREEKAKEDLLATFSLPEEFQLELFVAEPLVADPVDMEIDEEGRVYVVEMHGYPLDTEGSGKIKILKDTNNDGYPDTSVTFAERLILPTSIMRWKKGLLVTDAPDVIYLEDTNGDDVADTKKVILTGFARSNPQHNLNSPLYGLDNWIYLGHESSVHTIQFESLFGDRGKEIRYADDPQAPTLPQNANGRGTRFKPDTHQLEMLSSRTQYGHSFDEVGRYFLVNNSNHIYQEVIAQRYLERNPDLLDIPTIAYIPDHGNAAEVYPATTHAEQQLLTDVGVFTSACGITIYQGDLFPNQYSQVSFVAEPVHNLVHVDKVENNGPIQKASRLFEGKEFLTSTDPWFRPVNFYVGPDGALYVIDYYRKIIEHPEWMSDEVNNSGELYEGTDKGRIYCIVPKLNSKAPDFMERKLLDKSNADALVKNLANPNYWWRINAQRLLVDTQPASVVPLLENVINESSIEVEQIHALWTLHGMDTLRNEILIKALSTKNTGLLLNALRIAENRMDDPRIEKAIINLTSQNEEVILQLLLSLGNSENPKAMERRRNLLLDHVDNTWIQIAALTAKNLNSVVLWNDLTAHFSSHPVSEEANDLFNRLGMLLVRQGHQEKVNEIMKQALLAKSELNQILSSTLQGIMSGPDYKAKDELRENLQPLIPKIIDAFVLAKEGTEYDTWKSLLLFLGQSDNPSDIPGGPNKLYMISKDKNISPEKRSAALEVLAALNPTYDEINYVDFVHPQQPAKLQITALQILSKQMQDIQFSGFVVKNWGNFTHKVRDESVNLMLENNVRIAALLDAVEKNSISAAAIGWGRSVHLMTNEDVPLKNKARKLLDQFKLDKEKITEKFEGVENITGDLIKGKTVFETNCALCHQVSARWGKDFGPDLSSIRNQSKRSILVQIIEPNKAIADGYEIWTIRNKSGNSFAGIIASESSNAITLKMADGSRITIGREDITEITSSAISAMPEGLGNQINKEEMINLLEFLSNFNQMENP